MGGQDLGGASPSSKTPKIKKTENIKKTEDIKKVSSAAKRAASISKMCLVGIHGTWYDLTEFVKIHPGGDILWKFNQMDATEVFIAFHTKPGILAQGSKYRTKMTYRRQPDPVKNEYAKLSRQLVKEGMMSSEGSAGMWICNFVRLLLFFFISLALIKMGWYALAGIFLCGFWQQSGGLMHDTMHTNFTYDRNLDYYAGWLFGTVLFGTNSEWWRREHNIHHALTNSYTTAPETQSAHAYNYAMPDKIKAAEGEVEHAYSVDYQMKEDVYAQNEDVLNLFSKNDIFYFLIKYQHFYMLPAMIVLGRVGILVDSWRHGASLFHWFGFALHWCIIAFVLSLCPDWYSRAIVYYMSSLGEGGLHIQLVTNHYLNCWDLDESIANDFVRWVYKSTHNIGGPAWFDWYHLGLNLHIEHHLFPKVSRTNLRKIRPRVQAFGKAHGLEYRELFPSEILPSLFRASARVAGLRQAGKV